MAVGARVDGIIPVVKEWIIILVVLVVVDSVLLGGDTNPLF